MRIINSNSDARSVNIHILFPSGAPWVSQTANKRIIQAAKSAIEVDKLEQLLVAILYVFE